MELRATVTTRGVIFEGKAPEIIQKALDAVMYEAAVFLEGKVKALTPRRTGLLAGSIHGEVQKGIPVIKGIVAHQSKYGDLVEKGTGIYGPSGKQFTITAKNKKALFWKGAIHPVRKVVQKGFPGRHMFEIAFNQGWPTLQEIFDRAGFNIVRKLDNGE